MDYFNFSYFISIGVLKLFYIIGVLIIPFFSWLSLSWVIEKFSFIERLYRVRRRDILVLSMVWLLKKINFFSSRYPQFIKFSSLSLVQKIKFTTLFIVIVLGMEVFWRLMIEYMIAFMQIHEIVVSVGSVG